MPVTPLLPSLAVNPMVPAMLSEGLAVWTQRGREFRVGGGEPSRCPRTSERLDVGQEKRVRLTGICLAWLCGGHMRAHLGDVIHAPAGVW